MPSTGNILDVADHEGMVGDEGVSGTVEGHGRSPMALSGVATTFKTGNASEYQASPADSQYSTISQKQRIDAEMRLIFRSSSSTTLDPADDPRFA